MLRLSKHPLFLVGFRPMFTLAMISAILFPVSWALVFSGKLTMPQGLSPLAWHAHEMLFGFGWAVLGGFLLTASKNWVKIRGLHGIPLLVLSLAWVFERCLMLHPTWLESFPALRLGFLNFYIVGVSGYVLFSLWRYRQSDSYRDNFFFFIMMGLFIVAKNLLLTSGEFTVGISMSVGLFRLAFAVMFERTLTQFMKSTEQVELLRLPVLDYSIKFLILASVFESLLAPASAGALLVIAGLVFGVRWFLWKPAIGFRKFGNGIMYVGYMGIVLNLVLSGIQRWGYSVGTATTPLHLFAFMTMGVVISGMLVRICQGHTGRKPQFVPTDKIAIYAMMVAAIFRLVIPLMMPALYSTWILIAASLWACCFFLLSLRLIPFLFRPRIDGKEH